MPLYPKKGREWNMTHRERVKAILHYQDYDKMPVVHFGYWDETLQKWADEGHISQELAHAWTDGNEADKEIAAKLGFDFNWNECFGGNAGLMPGFEPRLLEEYPDGKRKVMDAKGNINIIKPGVDSIPAQVGTLMTGREAWEELYKPRLTYSDQRIDLEALKRLAAEDSQRTLPKCIHCGSLYGAIRDMIGVTDLAYLQADDEELYDEVIDTVGELAYRVAEKILSIYDGFDFAHFWEDICFKNGPLISPRVFREKVGPHYKRITDMLAAHGIDIVSLDCDGCIDKLVPVWLDNGVNTMFPIEVGVWDASIAPWRAQYGAQVRGVGGMNKTVFARERADIDAEVERLKGLIALGGYIPCPDHRIAPDAKWENVQYYCEKMQAL